MLSLWCKSQWHDALDLDLCSFTRNSLIITQTFVGFRLCKFNNKVIKYDDLPHAAMAISNWNLLFSGFFCMAGAAEPRRIVAADLWLCAQSLLMKKVLGMETYWKMDKPWQTVRLGRLNSSCKKSTAHGKIQYTELPQQRSTKTEWTKLNSCVCW